MHGAVEGVCDQGAPDDALGVLDVGQGGEDGALHCHPGQLQVSGFIEIEQDVAAVADQLFQVHVREACVIAGNVDEHGGSVRDAVQSHAPAGHQFLAIEVEDLHAVLAVAGQGQASVVVDHAAGCAQL